MLAYNDFFRHSADNNYDPIPSVNGQWTVALAKYRLHLNFISCDDLANESIDGIAPIAHGFPGACAHLMEYYCLVISKSSEEAAPLSHSYMPEDVGWDACGKGERYQVV